MTALIKVSRTVIAEITPIPAIPGGKPEARLMLNDPPLIGEGPIAYVPGQQIFLGDARKLYEALKAVFEPDA